MKADNHAIAVDNLNIKVTVLANQLQEVQDKLTASERNVADEKHEREQLRKQLVGKMEYEVELNEVIEQLQAEINSLKSNNGELYNKSQTYFNELQVSKSQLIQSEKDNYDIIKKSDEIVDEIAEVKSEVMI